MIPEKVLATFRAGETLAISTVAMRSGLEKRSVAVALGKLVQVGRLWRHGYDQYSLDSRPEGVFGAQDAVLRAMRENVRPRDDTPGTRRTATMSYLRHVTGLLPEECLKALEQLIKAQMLYRVKRGVYAMWNTPSGALGGTQ